MVYLQLSAIAAFVLAMVLESVPWPKRCKMLCFMTRLKDKPTSPDQYEGILCGDALAIPWRYETPQHVTGMHLGPQDGEGSDLFFVFPLSEAQHLCGWHGRWAQCAADWRQIRLGCFGFPLPHGKRLGAAFSTQYLCNVAGFALGWHFGLSLNWKAKKYTVSYPKKMGSTFCCTPEVGTFPWAMSLVAALVAFQFQPLGLYPKRHFLHCDRWPPLPPKWGQLHFGGSTS